MAECEECKKLREEMAYRDADMECVLEDRVELQAEVERLRRENKQHGMTLSDCAVELTGLVLDNKELRAEVEELGRARHLQIADTPLPSVLNRRQMLTSAEEMTQANDREDSPG